MKIKLTLGLFTILLFNPHYCLSDEPKTNSNVITGTQSGLTKEDIAARKYFDRIKEAVKKNDYNWLASQISYPVCLLKENGTLIFSNAKQLLEHKESFFNQNFNEAVLGQARDQIHSNYLGYVIGSGALHFDVGVIYPTNSENSLLKNCTTENINQHHKNTHLHYYSNLDGNWVLTDYVMNGIVADDSVDKANANLWKIATIRSNVLTLKCFGKNYNCRVIENPKVMKRDNCYYWEPSVWGSFGGGLKSEDFNFSEKIFYYKTGLIGENEYLRDVVVDEQKQKMILQCGGPGFYLFERIEK